MEQLHRLESLMHRHRQTHPLCQHALRRFAKLRLTGFRLRQRIVPQLPVIQVGKGDLTAPHAPALVRSDNRLGTVLVNDTQFRDQLPVIAVKSHVLQRRKPESRLIPAVAQKHRQPPGRLQKLRYIISLVLHPLVVIIAVRCQIFLPDPLQAARRVPLLRLIKGFIQPQTADIESGPFYRPVHLHILLEKGMPLLRTVTGDPLTAPGFLQFGCLKPLHCARSLFSRFTAHRHRPIITGVWF